MINHIYRKLLLTILTVLLTGCAHFQQKPTFQYIPWQVRQTKLLQYKNWIISGTFSITYNKKRDTAHFEWQQNQNNYIINISGPMNLNSAQIKGSANKVELCQPNSKCIQAKSSEKLLFEQFCWQLPVSNIRYWVFTLPVPIKKINTKQLDQYEHLTELEQQGWKINYFGFKSIKNIDMPSTIELKNENFFIKLKIKSYKLFN